MFGVYLLYSLRKLRNPFVAELFVFAMISLALSSLVSIPSVLSNMLESGNFYRYFMTAFSGTDLLVQMALVLVGLTALFLLKNITFHTVLKERFA